MSVNAIFIDDPSDPRIQDFASLRGDAEARASDCFIAEGRLCVERLLTSRYEVLSVLVERGKERDIDRWLSESTKVFSLPRERISELVGYPFHRGILACGRRPNLAPPSQFKSDAGPAPSLALAAVDINEHENLGSMVRSASAFGVEHLFIGPRTVDPFARRSIRVSMATIFTQHIYDLSDPIQQLLQLRREANLRTIVTTPDHRAMPLSDFVMDQRHTIVVVGNEAAGLDPQLQQIATDRITIPMHLGIDSLNVAVAAAVVLYQLRRAANEWTDRNSGGADD